MAKLDYNVIWADGARLDFRAILEYIAWDNPDASVRVGEKIIEGINQLKSFPELGSNIPEGPEVDARQLVEGKLPNHISSERGRAICGHHSHLAWRSR
ncbi:MAG: type II toxin-antitoxin system RelE/ParE family toxin [Verrucomicrobia bacterium]|nr:type II toxin-antitoxin system RelE/ParE family toxin [Verrucomicrobiota bacterium]